MVGPTEKNNKSPRKDGNSLRTSGPDTPGNRMGWKGPLILAFLVIAVAAGSFYWKTRPHSPGTVGGAEGSLLSGEVVPGITLPDVAANVVRLVDNTGPEAGYIGSDSCAQCHEGIAESYSHIAMGRSLYAPTAENIIEDYTTNNEFYHEPSSQYFRMTHEGDKFYQTSFQRDPAGKPINEKKVAIDYIVGSGANSRSYIHRESDGQVYQLPVAWYSLDKKWAMNPGYDSAHHSNYSRRITYDCLFCHAAMPDLPAGADRYNYGETAWFPEKLEAINCERCHGPAAEHVKLATSGAAKEAIAKSIVNPGNLDNKLQLEVCMQCHLETTSGNLPHSVHTVDKGIFGFRPGEPLEEYRYAFDHPKGTGHDDKFEIAGQAYRLRKSPCFIKSEGKMTCTTCHDPHRVPKDRQEAAIQSCLECHKPADCTEKMELRMPVKDNCIQCHMPQRRTDDVIHAVMTDHYIQRRPPPADVLLAPKKEHVDVYRGDVVPYYPKEIAPEVRDLYMGLAYISNSADVEKGIKHLGSYIAQNPSHFTATYTQGVGLKMLGQLDSAREKLELAVALEPSNPQAWMALGDLYEMMQNYTKSIQCYRQAAKISPKISRAYNGEGTSLLLSNDLEAAEKAFRAAIAREPFDDNPHLNLATIYLQKSDVPAAEAEARAALAINPGNPDGWMALAQCTLSSGRTNETIWACLESLKLNPANIQAYEYLLTACRMAGPAAAVPSLAAAAPRAPFSAGIAAALAGLEIGNTPAADDWLSSATRSTTAAAALPTAVRVALVANRPDLAIQWGQQAYQAMPEEDEAIMRYANALQATGKVAEAEALLKASLEKRRTPRLVNALAWLKSTAKDDNARNGTEAAALAEEAARLLNGQNIYVMQSQAAAAAELGDFQKASALIAEALKMAQADNLSLEIKRLEGQAASYQAGKPFRSDW